MHATSQENMRKCFERYLRGSFIEQREKVVLVDCGSADINGGYREIFSDPKFFYYGVDLMPAKGVDLVLNSPYQIPLANAYADVVVSGQMLEHCPYFWLSFHEMVRVLKPDGLLFLITPSSGPEHRYPVDCYRFYPDAYKALAQLSGCYLVDSWLDKRGPWKDLVGVFSKLQRSKWVRNSESSRFVQPSAFRAKNNSLTETTTNYMDAAEADAVAGASSYLELLEVIHRVLAPALYLEIGVRKGTSLKLARCPSVAIDPEPDVDPSFPETASLYRETSDDFFEWDAEQALSAKIDLAFIDGFHRFEYALRDFINAERYSTMTSVIVIDDIFPNHPVQAKRSRESRVWTGDVWKLLFCLRTFRADLILMPVNSSPAGSLLIAGLDPSNTKLIDEYNPIVRRFVTEHDNALPVEILGRNTALQPNDPKILHLLNLLRSCREESLSAKTVQELLRAFAMRFPPSSIAG